MEKNIDVSKEVELLENMLGRVSALVTIEESIDESGNIALLADTACEIASTIKYLKSDVIYETKSD